MPLIAVLAAMYLSEIGRPTAAQLRAKRTALLTVAAPTLFVFLGVVLNMLSNAVPDTLPWVAAGRSPAGNIKWLAMWRTRKIVTRASADTAALIILGMCGMRVQFV
jgi:hypothetical protein